MVAVDRPFFVTEVSIGCVHPRCKIATSHTTRREPPLSATLLLAPVVSADSVVDDHGF